MNRFCCYRAITLLVISLFCLYPISLASNYVETEDEKSFTYNDIDAAGPKNWGSISPEWKLCETGKAQSPIDIPTGELKVVHSLGRLKKMYEAAPAVLKNRGHDITVRWTGDAGRVSISGIDYKLIQGHWHSSSEHTLNGTRYELEVHLVHQTPDGKIAVIAILYKYGRADPFLAHLLPNCSKIKGFEEVDVGIVNPKLLRFGSKMYYRYIGSLTVPPCTEGVTWSILDKVREVSKEQVTALREFVRDGYEMNGRPVQPRNGREIIYFAPPPKAPPKAIKDAPPPTAPPKAIKDAPPPTTPPKAIKDASPPTTPPKAIKDAPPPTAPPKAIKDEM